MNRLQRDAIILELLTHLKSNGSWCGETHLQKATYFLQHLVGVPLGFPFILYKHGPYSFDLRDALTAMRADGLLGLQSHHPYPYGPSYVPGPSAGDAIKHHRATVTKYRDQALFVARTLGAKQVADLERISTALYVILDNEGPRKQPKRAIVKAITNLKPHITEESASEAVTEVENILKAARPGTKSG